MGRYQSGTTRNEHSQPKTGRVPIGFGEGQKALFSGYVHKTALGLQSLYMGKDLFSGQLEQPKGNFVYTSSVHPHSGQGRFRGLIPFPRNYSGSHVHWKSFVWSCPVASDLPRRLFCRSLTFEVDNGETIGTKGKQMIAVGIRRGRRTVRHY